MTLTAGADDEGRRLDRVLRRALPDMPLSGIHRLLRKGRVLVNGKTAGAETRIAAGAIITIPGTAAAPLPASFNAWGVAEDLPPAASSRGARLERRGGQNKIVRGKKMPGKRPPLPASPFHPFSPPFSLNILREDADLLFINKPAGLAVHGTESLDEAVRAYLADKLGASLSFRPGPLHRLDKPTSGLIVFSKTLTGAQWFSGLLREGRIKKRYLALVEGCVPGPVVWEDFLIRDRAERKTFPVGGTGDTGPAEKAGTERAAAAKRARTGIRPLAYRGDGPAEKVEKAGTERAAGCFSLILAELETGRTHQIRAQAAAHGFPLAGDKKYGGAFQPGGVLLHAWTLELPGTGGAEKPLRITAPLPERFRRRLEELFGKDALRIMEAALRIR
jgi:23S rRNA pseudouridine955/2504/2580 synthase